MRLFLIDTSLSFEFLCCLTMPGLSKDIQQHTRHLHSHQDLIDMENIKPKETETIRVQYIYNNAAFLLQETVFGICCENENPRKHTLCKKASNHHANLPLEMYSFTL